MNCGICGQELNVPFQPETLDCGGHCLKCMADCGDPECEETLRGLNDPYTRTHEINVYEMYRLRLQSTVKLLPGLPPYGPMPTAFPPEWGSVGREGTVVEFAIETGAWVANFRPGLGGLQFAALHPEKLSAVVIAAGDLWIIDTGKRTGVRILPAIEAMWEVQNPEGWVFSRQGIAFARLGPQGLMWHTRRLSFDGFDQVAIDQDELRGFAWSPIDDKLCPFRVELATGKSEGGSYFRDDTEAWELLFS